MIGLIYRACKALLRQEDAQVGALRERDGFVAKKIADEIRSYNNKKHL
jgi:hypothetical protein